MQRLVCFIGLLLIFNMTEVLSQSSPVVNTASQHTFEKQPVPYTAEYIFKKKGVSVAYITIELKQDGRYWIYHTQAKPYGVGAWFTDITAQEISRFYFDNNELVPLSHRYEQTGKRRDDKSFAVIFADAARTAQVRKADGEVEYALPDGIYDRQSVLAAMMLHLQQGNPQPAYAVFDEDEIKDYVVDLEGEETLKTVLGQQITLKAGRTAKNKTTLTWFAKQLQFVPVKVEQYKKGNLDFVLEINALKFEDPALN